MKKPDWRRGLAWKDEKLYAFEKGSVLVMRMWPHMLAWRRTKTKAWSATRRHADALLCAAPLAPGELERYALLRNEYGGPPEWDHLFEPCRHGVAAALPALQTIPERERRIAARLTDRRWHALALMARCPGASDLFESNAALAFALASSWVLKAPRPTQPMRAARRLVSRPQIDIMDWLGLPATERVRRILRRIEPEALTGKKLPQLRRALQCPGMQSALAHTPRIGKDAMCFLTDARALHRLTPRLLVDLSHEPAKGMPWTNARTPRPATLWQDACQMARALEVTLPAKIASLEHLKHWHDDLLEDYLLLPRPGHVQSEIADPHQSYPPPPWQEAWGMWPIRSFEELCQEGRDMHHCVASYHQRILARQYFVYRITHPFRGTLGIQRVDGEWCIDQLVGARNAEISEWGHEEVLRRIFEISEQWRLSAPGFEAVQHEPSQAPRMPVN